MKLVLFDFDGTLTNGDTMLAFVRFTRGSLRYFAGMLWLSPVMLLHLLKIVSAEKAKKILLRHFFGGWEKENLFAAGEKFAQEKIPSMLRKDEWNKLQSYQKEKAECCIVTASCDAWISAFCKIHDLRLICTEMEFEADSFRGNFRTPNCNREEKAARIRQTFDLTHYQTIIAYGNKGGDDAMLQLAHERYYVI